MRIVVVGGSGLVGTILVDALRHRGHDVLSASSRSGVDTVTGDGLSAALMGANAVIDVTNSPSFEDVAVMEFFRTSTSNLLAAASAARVRHFIALSVVGTDRLLDSGYFRAKLAQEELIERAPIPHTILRSTQFFEFMPRIAEADASGHTLRVSSAWVQPIARGEVAAALADIATAPPRNGMIEAAGPDLFRLDAVVRRVMDVIADPRDVVTDTRARYFGAELSEDSLIPDEGAIIAVTRFDGWLKTIASSGTTSQLTQRSSRLRIEAQRLEISKQPAEERERAPLN